MSELNVNITPLSAFKLMFCFFTETNHELRVKFVAF